MDALVRVALPVGLHRSSVRPAEHTLILKSTYVLAHGGYAQLAPLQEALREAQREGGRLIYPTDFSESKAACDVVFVGPVLLGDGPVSLRAGVFQRNASSPRVFGPAVQLDRQWAASCAPADGRMPFPAMPLALEMVGAAFRMSSTLPAPMPLAALVVRERWSHMIGVALRVDTILIDPMRSAVEVITRGTFSYSGDVHQDVIAVVDTQAALASTTPEQMREWSRMRVVDATFRRPAPTERQTGTAPMRKPAATQRLVPPTVAAPIAPPPQRSAPPTPQRSAPPPPQRSAPPLQRSIAPTQRSVPPPPQRAAAVAPPAIAPPPRPDPLARSARPDAGAPPRNAYVDDPPTDDAPTFDGDESTFVLGEESLEDVIEAALAGKPPPAPNETMTIDVDDADLLEPPTIPPPPPSRASAMAAVASLGRLDTMTLDAPSTLDTPGHQPSASGTPWSPVFNPPPDQTGILPIPEILKAQAGLPPWIAAAAPAATPSAPNAAGIPGLPPLPSLSSLVVARDAESTTDVRMPAFVPSDVATGPTWLAPRKSNSAATLSREGTPFRTHGGDRPAELAAVQPVSALAFEQTAMDLSAVLVAPPPVQEPARILEPVKPPSALAGMGMSLQRGIAPVAPEPAPPPLVMQPMMGMARLQPAPENLMPPPAPSSPGLVVPPPPASVRPDLVPASGPSPSSRGSSPGIPKGDRSYSDIKKPDLMTPNEEVRKKPKNRPQPGTGPRIEGLTVEEYAYIRAALWADESHRKEILKENGLTELKWKVIDRRWSKHIESLAEKPNELATLLEILQRATIDR